MRKAKGKAPRRDRECGEAPAKKPRRLSAWWGSASCHPDGDGRCIDVDINAHIDGRRAIRLSQWLAAAAAWKAEE